MTQLSVNDLYVISDLHIGGKDRQIFAGKAELPWLLDDLRAKAKPENTIALVINGDFIDFLAEDDAKYFDADGAVNKLNRIAADPTFSATFAALGRFANEPHCTLVINLGNHDLELCLPEVQAAFVSCCAINDARLVIWVDDGVGVRVKVGARDVLCLHGNEADVTNHVDFDRLREIKRARQTGKPIETAKAASWIPNAGTQLVIDAMNPIKKQHPFIDVLKPEDQAAIRVLLALDYERAKSLAAPAFKAMFIRGGKDRIKNWFGLLSEDEILAGGIPKLAGGQGWLDDIDEDYKNSGRRALTELERQGSLGAIDDFKFAWEKWRGRDGTQALREALKELAKDRSFAVGESEKMNEDLLEFVDPDLHFLCSGHTHFARSLSRGLSTHHFNSGTWAYLMKIEDDTREDSEKFGLMIAALRNKATLEQLAKDNFLIKQLTVIRIKQKSKQQSIGELFDVKDQQWRSIPNTQRTI